MLLTIVDFYVLLTYALPLSSPGRWQQATTQQPIEIGIISALIYVE